MVFGYWKFLCNILLKTPSYFKPLDLRQLKQSFLYSPQCLQQWPLDLRIRTRQKKSSVQTDSHMYGRQEGRRCIKTPLETNTHKQHVAHFHANSFLTAPCLKVASIYSCFSRPSHHKALAYHSLKHHALHYFPQQCLLVEKFCSEKTFGWNRKK